MKPKVSRRKEILRIESALAGGFFTASATWDTGLATTQIGPHNPFSNFPQPSVDKMGLDRSLNNTQVKHSAWIFTYVIPHNVPNVGPTSAASNS